MRSIPVTRRAFLRATTFSAGMLTLSHLRLLPRAAFAAGSTEGLRLLTIQEASILTAIAERFTATGDADMPSLRETDAISTIDSSLLFLDSDVREQFRWALTLFEYGPLLFDLRLSRFTGLGPEERDAHIRGWAESRFATRRLVYRALKNISFLGYYSQDSTWKGISYGGPWLPRPRRSVPL